MGYSSPPKYGVFDYGMFPYIPQGSFSNMFEFGNSMAKSFNGKEQIQCFQKGFKTFSSYTFIVASTIAERVISSLYRPEGFLVPLWYQREDYKTDIPAGTVEISCEIDNKDWEQATHIFIKSSETSFEFIEINSVGASSVFLKTPTQMPHYANDTVILSPAFESFLSTEPKAKEYPEDGLIELSLDFVIKSRYQLKSTIWSYPVTEYKDRLVIEIYNSFSGDFNSNTLVSKFELIDLEAGRIRNLIDYKTPPIIRSWGTITKNYTDVRDLVKLFQYLKGMQKLVYVPTLRNEFKLIENVSAGGFFIRIKDIGVSKIFENYMGSRSIYFATPDGIFIRDITAVSPYGTDGEEILFSTVNPYDLNISNCHICWLILSRSASNSFSIEQETLNNASCYINFVEVRVE